MSLSRTDGKNPKMWKIDHQVSYKLHHDARRKKSIVDVLNAVNSLLPQRNDIDSTNEEGVTALISACEKNDISQVKSLLGSGASVNAADIHGRTPLMICSAEGNKEILQILVRHRKKVFLSSSKNDKSFNESTSSSGGVGSDDTSSIGDDVESCPNLKSMLSNANHGIVAMETNENDSKHSVEKEVGHSPDKTNEQDKKVGIDSIAKLVKWGSANDTNDDCALLLPDVVIDSQDKYGWTALMYASLCGHDAIVSILLDLRANPNALNIKQRTALHVAAAYNRVDIVEILLKRGCVLNALDVHEWTPAMVASKKGALEVVLYLLNKGASSSVNEESLLCIAASYGHLNLVIALLERKEKPSLGLVDKENENVLIKASEHKHLAIVEFMLEYGVSINARNFLNQSALIRACANGNDEIVNYLIDKGADVELEDDMGGTPLLYSCSSGMLQVVKLLISKGIKVGSASAQTGRQALMCAASQGHLSLVAQLIEQYGASINAVDHTKKTALHYSCIGGHADIAEYLIGKKCMYKKDKFNCTPLYYARSNGHFEAAAVLEHKYLDKKILMRSDLQPVGNPFEVLLLMGSVVAAYFDIAFDVLNAYAFYHHGQFRYFGLALFFQVIPLLAAVTLQKGWGTKMMAVLQLSMIRELYHSLRGKVETPMMCTLRIIETCLEACPSSLLQLYVLIEAWLLKENTSHGARGFYGFLATRQEQILAASILISIGSTSVTFVKFVASEKDRLLMPFRSLANVFVDIKPEKLSAVEVLYCYHCSEECFRLISLAVLFLSLRRWALITLALSYMVRMLFATVIFKAESFSEATSARQIVKVYLRIALSLITDCLWYDHFKLTASLQVLSTLEGLICSLILLYVADRNTFRFSRIQVILVVGVMAWTVKTLLYLSTYFWMRAKSISQVAVENSDVGLYYSACKSSPFDASDASEVREGNLAQAEARLDRKNYFKTVMKSVNKREHQGIYKYEKFPPAHPSILLLLRQIKQETCDKNMGLKRGLTNVQHNEDFHLLYKQFFEATKRVAPHTINSMINASARAARTRARVARSPFRLLFDYFIELQLQGLLWPSSELSPSTVRPSAFPDRIDWVEFLDFVRNSNLEKIEISVEFSNV